MSSLSKITSACALSFVMAAGALTQTIEAATADTTFQNETPLLKNADPKVRISAIEEISGPRSESPAAGTAAFKLLLPMLNDSSSDVRVQAVYRLGVIAMLHPEHAKEAMDIMLPLLGNQESQIRYYAADSVIGLVEHVPDADLGAVYTAILPLLHDSQDTLQERGVAGVGLLAANCANYVSPALDALRPMATSRDDSVRSAVVDILAIVAMLRAESRPAITTMLGEFSNDPEPRISQNAAELRDAMSNPPAEIAAGTPSRACPKLP